jgi:serine/threonine-protein kinase
MERLVAGLSDRYAIKRELGRGGMATVYLAEDVRHHRDVALKVLHPELAAVIGADRFLREIEIAASLTSPHILPLHESGQFDNLLFYVMPYVAGESLRDRLRREKQLPVEQAVRLASQVARALEYAHDHGVIHRDIKPENILLAGDDAVVTDFGIARAVTAAGGERLTETGLSLGTPHYMSPEQAAGQADIDARTDIYSLGCVLYEMLAGDPPFTGPNVQAIIARVLTEDPAPVRKLRPSVPVPLAVAVHKAIGRLPADRFSGAAQFGEAIERAMEAGSQDVTIGATPIGPPRRRVTPVSILLPLATAVLAAAVVWLVRSPQSVTVSALRFEVPYPSGHHPVRGAPPIAISPDGRMIAFTARDSQTSRLFVRAIDEFESRALAGTEGAHTPFFSPDGNWIGFVGDRSIFKVAVTGGLPVQIAEAPFVTLGATWVPGTIIVGGVGAGLMRVAETGGSLELLARGDSSSVPYAAAPTVTPDGRHVIATLQNDRTAMFSIETGAMTSVDGLQGAHNARVWRDRLVFAVGDELRVAPFDEQRLTPSGPSDVLQDAVYGTRGGTFTRFSYFALADNGTLAYVPGGFEAEQSHVVWVDRSGRSRQVVDFRGQHFFPHLSPDGKRVAVQEGNDVWVYDVERGTRTALTRSGGTDPTWHPDGQRVTYASAPSGSHMSLYTVVADGSEDSQLLFTAEHPAFPHSWSPDGSALAFYQVSPTSARDILVLRKSDNAFVADSFLVTRYNERSPVFSPDGKWIAYTSDESGTDEIYVRPYPGPGGKWTISRGGGREPVWSRDGRSLFFRRGSQVLAVAMQLRPKDLTAGEPTVIVSGGGEQYFSVSGSQSYDVSLDGQRFLMTEQMESSQPQTFRVIVGWLR